MIDPGRVAAPEPRRPGPRLHDLPGPRRGGPGPAALIMAAAPVVTDHPVLEVLRERRRAGSRPGERADPHRVALVAEGGGMRGVVSSAMTAALEQAGLTDALDLVVGASAGALNGAALVSGVAAGCCAEAAGGRRGRRPPRPTPPAPAQPSPRRRLSRPARLRRRDRRITAASREPPPTPHVGVWPPAGAPVPSRLERDPAVLAAAASTARERAAARSPRAGLTRAPSSVGGRPGGRAACRRRARRGPC